MVLLWLVNLTCTSHNCPPNLLSEVFSCLQNLTNGSNQSQFIDAELMKRNCKSGAFDDSVQCLERLYKQCSTPVAREWLEKIARPGRWKSGFDRFCTHVDRYMEQKECIQRQNVAVKDCVSRNTDPNIVNSPPQNFNGISISEHAIESTCRLFHWTDKCLDGELGQSCGVPVGAIVKDFHGGITPPICVKYQTSISSRASYTSNSIVILCTIICSLLVQYR